MYETSVQLWNERVSGISAYVARNFDKNEEKIEVTAKARHLGIQLGINEEKCRKAKELSRMYFVKDSPIKVEN